MTMHHAGEGLPMPHAPLSGAPRFTSQTRFAPPEGVDPVHPRAAELADAMRELASAGATLADLVARGFTMAEIAEHEPMARKLADEAIVRQVSPPGDRVPEIIQKAIDAMANRMPLTAGMEATAEMTSRWRRYCAARAAFKLDPWISQSERCIHLLGWFLALLPLLPREANRIIYALAAENKAALSRHARHA